MKKIIILSIYSLLFLVAPIYGEPCQQAPGDPYALIDKRRTISKIFSVKTQDRLLVNNQFGDVKVNLWNKKEIRIDITITASAPTDERADDYLNSVRIQESQDNFLISLKTEIDKTTFGNNGWNNWKGKSEGKNSIKIDYTVSMPEDMPLVVLNKFGNISIPKFLAVLKVESSYGDFYAETLKNDHNTISIAFGNAMIKKIDGGTVQSKYSDLQMDRAGSITLVNKFGKLNIGEINKLMADIDYSNAKIGTLNKDAKVKLNFSNNFRINQCTADNIDIDASYSSIYLPAEPGSFDVTVSHGQFNYPEKGNLVFINNRPSTETRKVSTTRQYEGKIGVSTDNGTTLKIVSRFGSVNLKE